MSGRFKRILALMLALVLASALCGAAAAEETENVPANADTSPAEGSAVIPPEYKLAARSSRFSLYVREDTLAIILESRKSGSLLYSTVQNPDDFKDQAAWKGFYQSGIVMEFIEDVKSTNTQADFINMEADVSVTYLENGFSADVFFPAYGVG